MSGITFGIITVSDTCSSGTNTDTSGPKLREAVLATIPSAVCEAAVIVPDDQDRIKGALLAGVIAQTNVLLTTGGTGFGSRDVTPEATRAVIEREAPALSYVMCARSLQVTELAMLSRAVCGIRSKTLIINLPGSPKAAVECFGFIKEAIPHAVALITGDNDKIISAHKALCTKKSTLTTSPSKVICNSPATRIRKSPYPMLEVSHALKIIQDTVDTHMKSILGNTFTVKLAESLGYKLAVDVYSKDPVPPFPASIKDGYAVKAEDGVGVRVVRNVVIAGDSPINYPLQSGEVIRISTGAPIPAGADAVVQVEDTTLIKTSPDGRDELEIEILTLPTIGQDIRPIGKDIPANTLVGKINDLINPGHIGEFATVGCMEVKVFPRQFSIGILSTGNELQSPNEIDLKPGHIRDSNKLTLITLLQKYGITSCDVGIARDKPDFVKTALETAFQTCDVVISTGGVSMGEYDVIKRVLVEDFQAKILFGRLNMKPGKPTTFASLTYKNKPKLVFALPGNPASATVTAILFVIPFLKFYSKLEDYRKNVTLMSNVKLDERPEYVRAFLEENSDKSGFSAYLSGDQISSRIGSFVTANALLELPGKSAAKVDVLVKGKMVSALLL